MPPLVRIIIMDRASRAVRLILAVIDTINRAIPILAGASYVFVMLIVLYEVIARSAFHQPTSWVQVLATLVTASAMILSGGYVLLRSDHIRIDLIFDRFNARKKAVFDLLTSPFFFFYVGLLIYVGTKFAMNSWEKDEHYRGLWPVPIYPFKTIIPLGAFLLFLQGVAKLVRDIRKALTAVGSIEH